MTNEGEVKLLKTRFSPFGQCVHIALELKGIPFELIHVDLQNKPQLLLEANPIHKKVPVIIHDGKPVAESLIILEYLEDAWPEQVPLLPTDAHEKAKARFWCDYIMKGYSTFLTTVFATKPESPERQAAIEANVNIVKTLNAAMAGFSADGPFFTGDKFGLADVVLAPFLNTMVVLEKLSGVVFPGPDEMPRLQKWIEAVKVHPIVRSILPSQEESVTYFSALLEKRAAAAAAAAAPA